MSSDPSERTLKRGLECRIGKTPIAVPTEAVAQIVFTATGAPGASQVELLVNGKKRRWPRGDGSLEGGPLTRFMFPALNPSSRPDYPPLPPGGGPVATTAAPVTTTIPAK